MDVTIDERFSRLISDRVESGASPDASAVVNEALAAMFDQERADLRAAIARGDAQAAEGRVTRRTPGLLRQILEEERAGPGAGSPASRCT